VATNDPKNPAINSMKALETTIITKTYNLNNYQ